jgi:hypothetical protein
MVLLSGMTGALGKWWEEVVLKVMESVRECLRGMIISNLEKAFSGFNDNISEFTTSLSSSPDTLVPGVQETLRTVSENAVLPVGIIILAFVFVCELYEFMKDTNASNSFNQGKFIEIVGVTLLFMLLIMKGYDIAMMVMRIGAEAVTKTSASATISIPNDLWSSIATEEDIGTLISAVVTSFIIKLSMSVIKVALWLCMYIRIFEIYIYSTAAPAPLATLQSKEWNEVGKNFIRILLALSMQAFFMILMVLIYGKVMENANFAGNLDDALFRCIGYSILVVLMLFKAGNISKSIFNAH